MAFKLIGAKRAPYDGDGIDDIIKEFLCDTDADFADLPQCSAGSAAVSIESGTVKVMNTQGQWVTFGSIGGSGGGSTVNVTKRFTTMAVFGAGMPAAPMSDNLAVGGATIVYSDNILPTKTTDGVLVSDGQTAMHVYYIEDENEVFIYGDLTGTGVNDWMSFGALMGGDMPYCGVIYDRSQATATGFYALIEYVADGPGENIEMKFRGMIMPDAGLPAMELASVMLMNEILARDVAVLPTKTTDDILVSGPDGMFIYYIEDENDIFFYCDMSNSGTNDWVSASAVLPTLDKDFSGIPYGGTITDKSEATEVGYYALIEYIGDPEHFGN